MYHHRIPCYGDLTPGIPDVVDTESKSRLASLLHQDLNSRLPQELHRRSGDQELLKKDNQISPDLLASCYACLRLQSTTGDLKAALAVARDFSPRVMTASDREVLVDISGLGRLIGPPHEIARQLAHALFDAGLTASIAIGPTQTIARLLAHGETAHGPTLRHKAHKDHEDHNALCDLCDLRGLRGLCVGACGRGPWMQLPVHFLQELEAGLKACATAAMNERDRLRPYETLQRWGIERLGDLAALPPADLSSRLGRRGAALQQLARGLDPRPFVPDRETRRFVERLELEWPIDSLEPLSFVLARLFDPLSDALERADRGAVAIRLELRLTDRSTFTRVLPLPVPMRDARVLRTLIMLALESHPPPAAIDIVSLELDPAPARIVRFSLLDRALPSPETLATLTARLSALVGESRVGSPVLLDSHEPDAFEMQRFNPEIRRDLKVSATDAAATFSAVPAVSRHRMPRAIRVAVERGRPVHIASSMRGIPYGAITDAAGPWRASGGWWTAGSAEGQGAWNRNEWDVALKSGAVCRIYQDRTTDRWFLEGVYD